MKSVWKGALAGGVAGMGYMAYRAYKKDEAMETAVAAAARVSATSMAVGAALGVLLDASRTVRATDTKSASKKKKSGVWVHALLAAVPLMDAASAALGKAKTNRASRRGRGVAHLRGALGAVRLSTIRLDGRHMPKPRTIIRGLRAVRSHRH